MIFYASIEKVSEQKTIVYPNIIMATLVVGNVDVDVDVDDTDYGSTHDEEIVVPLTLMDHNCNSTNTKHPSSIPSWKTKKLMFAGIIGMTAAVASSALLFLSIMVFPNKKAPNHCFFSMLVLVPMIIRVFRPQVHGQQVHFLETMMREDDRVFVLLGSIIMMTILDHL